ncbi:hypothetical protein [Candidatus Amarobacter glycogenicus]|uniref:hypothetical protein n=1 Tax=Candidatus Amarobacter glycogenicus TaxID=3140699 RepID=UPI003136C871|nr:hypothetical protein [Dehalococcoidia bacterium]
MADEELGQLCRARAELVEKALKHHQAGAYEASVPIVLAQIDGLVRDMTDGVHGSSRGWAIEATFATRQRYQASMRASSAPEVFGARQDITSSTGAACGTASFMAANLIRHEDEQHQGPGLLAVIEWAVPRAREIAEQKDRARGKVGRFERT